MSIKWPSREGFLIVAIKSLIAEYRTLNLTSLTWQNIKASTTLLKVCLNTFGFTRSDHFNYKKYQYKYGYQAFCWQKFTCVWVGRNKSIKTIKTFFLPQKPYSMQKYIFASRYTPVNCRMELFRSTFQYWWNQWLKVLKVIRDPDGFALQCFVMGPKNSLNPVTQS